MPSLRTLTRPMCADHVIDDLMCNPHLRVLLDALPRLGLPPWWLAGPSLAASIWNVLDDRPAALGIDGYHVLYDDPRDLGYAAEDAVASRVRAGLDGTGIAVTVRNVARAHLRLEEELGLHVPAFADVREFVAAYATTASCLALHHDGDGRLDLFAPHGVQDVYARRTVPAPRRAVGTPAPGRRRPGQDHAGTPAAHVA